MAGCFILNDVNVRTLINDNMFNKTCTNIMQSHIRRCLPSIYTYPYPMKTTFQFNNDDVTI